MILHRITDSRSSPTSEHQVNKSRNNSNRVENFMELLNVIEDDFFISVCNRNLFSVKYYISNYN